MLNARQLRDLRSSPTAPNRVKKAIALAETTHEAVADALGVSQPHVTKIANGSYPSLRLETCRALAHHFGCSVEDLFPSQDAAVNA